MNIVLIAHEIPYLPNHGNRVNTWNWILGLKKLGHKVYLITWCETIKNDLPTPQEIAHVEATVDGFTLFRIQRNLMRVVNLLRLPSLTAARVLSKNDSAIILQQSKEFKADFIVLDSIFCAEVGFKLSTQLNVPLAVRLNNLEYIYYKGQFKLAKSVQAKLSLFACLFHLKKYEEKVIALADYFVDVSINDIEYWYKKGYTHGHCIPPIFLDTNIAKTGNNKQFDVAFMGNLNSPNNVDGVKWFLQQVLPIIENKLPNVQLALIGSSPSQILKEMVQKSNNVTLIANPAVIEEYYEKSNVLINPVLFGSGVNVKSINMLFSNNQVVTTSAGIKGLPQKFTEVFFVTDAAENFASTIVEIVLGNQKKSLELRDEVKAIFNEKALGYFVDKMIDIKLKDYAA